MATGIIILFVCYLLASALIYLTIAAIIAITSLCSISKNGYVLMLIASQIVFANATMLSFITMDDDDDASPLSYCITNQTFHFLE